MLFYPNSDTLPSVVRLLHLLIKRRERITGIGKFTFDGILADQYATCGINGRVTHMNEDSLKTRYA